MKYFVYLLLLVCVIPLSVSAQGLGAFGVGQQMQLVTSPKHPKPGQTVKITIENGTSALFGASIDWLYDGQPVLEGSNRQFIEVTAGQVGDVGTVEAAVTPTNGGRQTLQTNITPVYLDIIVEPQTRVPHWYAGRAMPSIGSQVNVTALVNDGSFINPANLVYTWRVDNRIIDGGSVRGRNKLTLTTPRGNDFVVSVTAARTSGEVVASRSVEVDSVAPELRFYEQHSLYGPSLFPLSNAAPFVGNTVTIQAEPYYLDTRVYNNPGIAQWEINRVQTDNGSLNPYEITLQQAAANGQTNLNFHVRSLQTVLQGAEEAVTLTF